MRRFARKIKDLFGPRATQRRRPATRQLDVEALEQRSVPTVSANTSAVVLGTTFIDTNANGSFNAGEHVLPGATVTLTGTTYLKTPLSVTTTSAANGTFKFAHVPAGSYQLQFPSVGGFTAEDGGTVSIVVGKGQTVSRNLGFTGLASGSLSLRQFLTDTSSVSSLPSLPTPGPGQTNATGPTVKSAVTNLTLAPSTATAPAQLIDLAGVFTAPDLGNSTIQVNTNHGSFDVTLFDQQAPEYVSNFYDYINAGDYNNSVFTRLVAGFVLQGGGALFQATTPNTGGLVPTTDLSPTLASGTVAGVPNEVGIPNTLGTLSMAMTGAPNTATNEFFFNLGDNSILGPTGSSGEADGGFTVFGEVTPADLNTLLSIVKAPNDNFNENTFTATGETTTTPTPAATALPGVDLTNVPLFSYAGGASSATFANDTTASNFLSVTSITSVSRPEVLTYTVSNSNPTVLTATLTDERLTLTPQDTSGKATITVMATDQYGNSTTTSFTVTVDSAPAVTVSLDKTSPNPGDTVTATATPTDAGQAPVSLTYVWKVNGKTVQTDTHKNISTTTATPDTDTFKLTNVKAGAKVTVTVTPNDGLLSGSAVTTTAIVNTPPVINALKITPASPSASSTLTANVSASDADGDPITFTYVWAVNGKTVQTDSSLSSTTDALTPAADNITLKKGDKVEVTVTPNDGKINGAASSSSVTLVDSAPVVNSVTLTPTSFGPDDTLTATVTDSDADGDPVNLTYVWQVNGKTVQTTSKSSSLTSTLNLSKIANVKLGDTVEVLVTPNDGTLNGTVGSATTIVDHPPVVNSVTLAPTSPNPTDTLTATVQASDADGDPITLTYVWKVDGNTVQTTTSTSKTTDTLNLGTISNVTVNPGDTVTVTVTPNDGKENGTTGSASVTVNTPPVVNSVTLAPTSPNPTDTLTATVQASDADGDPVTLTYVWQVNGTTVQTTSSTSSTTDTLNLGTISNVTVNPGDTVTVTVTPNDGKINGTTGTASVTVNSPPVINSLTLSPTSPVTTDTVTATVQASDADNDPITFTYVWQLNGNTVQTTSSTSSTSDSLDLTSIPNVTVNVGDTLSLMVTPNDGKINGTPSSTSVVIG